MSAPVVKSEESLDTIVKDNVETSFPEVQTPLGNKINYPDFLKKMDNYDKTKFPSGKGFQLPEKSSNYKKIKKNLFQESLIEKRESIVQEALFSFNNEDAIKSLEKVYNTDNYRKNFQDYALRYNWSESRKESFRNSILDFVTNNETEFSSEVFKNEPNYYKKYSLKYKISTNEDVTENSRPDLGFQLPEKTNAIHTKKDFALNISFIYNDETKSYYIDNFECTLNSIYMMNSDLGLDLGVKILEIICTLEKEDNIKIAKNIFKTLEGTEKKEVLRNLLNSSENSNLSTE